MAKWDYCDDADNAGDSLSRRFYDRPDGHAFRVPAWLYDLLKPRVTKLVVCDPRRNALLQEGNQNDRVDARKLAELLHHNQLRSVYHGDHGLRTLKELVRSYLTITKDLSRVMTRVKAIYRSWAIPCTGKQVYSSRHRAEWL